MPRTLPPRSFPWPGAARVAVLAAGLLLAWASTPALAQWKWRDKAGQLHVSDRPPPPDIPEASILGRPPGATTSRAAPAAAPAQTTAPAADAASVAPPATAPSAPVGVDPALEAKRKAAEQEKAARDQAEKQRVAAAKAENCQRARAALQSFESGQRIARTNAQGEREFMDDATRQREADRARQAVASDCR